MLHVGAVDVVVVVSVMVKTVVDVKKMAGVWIMDGVLRQ